MLHKCDVNIQVTKCMHTIAYLYILYIYTYIYICSYSLGLRFNYISGTKGRQMDGEPPTSFESRFTMFDNMWHVMISFSNSGGNAIAQRCICIYLFVYIIHIYDSLRTICVCVYIYI